MRLTGLLASTLIVIAAFLCPAKAADIQFTNTETCTITLKGQIESRDAERWRNVLSAIVRSTPTMDPSHPTVPLGVRTLCLDSAGGNLSETVAIAESVSESWMTTILQPNSECLSSCALIFMMGRLHEEDWYAFSRKMHFTSKLGFHRPSLDIRFPELVRSDLVMQSFDVALEAALGFLRLGNKEMGYLTQGLIPADLMELIFSQEAGGLYIIDDVNKVGRWNIEVYGFRAPNNIDSAGAHHACDNLAIWHSGLVTAPVDWSDTTAAKASLLSTNGKQLGENTYFVYGSNQGWETHYCAVDWDHGKLSACGEETGTDFRVGGCTEDSASTNPESLMREVTPLGLYHPFTKLAELDRASREIERRADLELKAVPSVTRTESSLWSDCSPASKSLRVVNVSSFVNLRSATDLNSSVVDEIPLGTVLTFAGEIRASKSCQKLCVDSKFVLGFGDEDKRKLAACYEDNAIWYKLNASNGKSGWISGKFLDVVN